MIEAPIPNNERQRLRRLYSLGLLDTQPEERFDRITRLAQQLFDVPIVVITLLDKDRQWFKSVLGLAATETPRDLSFCGHAICQDEMFIVEDTHNDNRFHDNPLVQDNPNIRFYAGQQLKTSDGLVIGTLAIIDTKARTLNATEQKKLADLARWVELEISQPGMGKIQAKYSPKMPFNRVPNELVMRLSSRPFATLITALIAAILIASCVSWYQQKQETSVLNNTKRATEVLTNIRGKIETELNSRLFLTKGLAGLVKANPDISYAQFQTFAESLGGSSSAIRSLQLAPNGIVQYVWPLAPNKAAIGHNLLKDPARRAAAEQALMNRSIWIAGPHTLLQGGQALIGRLPIYLSSEGETADSFWGFATILIDMPAFLQEVGLNDASLRELIAIHGSDSSGGDGEIFYGHQSTSLQAVATAQVSLPAGSWELSIKAFPAFDEPKYDLLFWLISGIICIFVPLLLYLLLRLPSRFQIAVEEAKTALEQSEVRFRDAIDALPDGFVIFDSNDRLITCNDRYRSLYELSRDYLQQGRSFEEIIRYAFNKGQFCVNKQDDIEALIAQRLERHLQPNGPAMEEQLASGHWVRVVERPIRGGGSVGFLVDITELKENEIELAKSRDKAESANKSKSAFLATMSHEVRTPMNVILGLLEVVNEIDSLPKEQKNYLDTAYKSAQQLLHLLNEILDISKMEANKLQLDEVSFNVETVIENVLTLTDNTAKDKNLSIIKNITQLPEKMVCGDQSRLQQILINLISNAIKFTDSGTIEVKVSSRVISEEKVEVHFSVSDTGIGFSDEQRDLLFNHFSQIDNSSRRKHEGTGLGLAICKQLVELMGGEITAQGQPGEGAVFSFYIPFHLSNQTPVRLVKDITEHNSPTVATQAFNILLAEDSLSNQIVFQAMLNASAYQLHIVNDGKEALSALKSHEFDAVLMDIYMPEMDGITATQQARADSNIPHVPIIALTANAMQGDQDRFIEAGMDDYLAKPVNKQSLIDILDKWTAA